MTENVKFKIKNEGFLYEYLPLNDNSYLVRSWFNGDLQPEKVISTQEATMTYDYCTSMWIDYDVEVIK